jgi:hypothetical protein
MPIHLPPLSRRQFVSGAVAAGAGLLLPGQGWAAEPPLDPNRWALLADTHVWERRDDAYRGAKPGPNFIQAREEILTLRPRPARAIVAGDNVFLKGHAADYAVLLDLVKPLRASGMALDLALGNHDHRETFWQAMQSVLPKRSAPSVLLQRQVAVLETAAANWFLLDSLEKTNSTPGLLGQAQLDWLAKELDARREKPALVLTHHYPTGFQGLRDGAALLELLAPRRQVKAHVFGHSHIWQHSTAHGIHLVNLPATAWVFDQAQPHAWVDMTLAAGGATLVLHSLDKKHPKHGERLELTWRAG